ncbi:cupin domain-containing protein [Nesterenkonia alba]|uniref:cupin domain-containing protein n=1 Tax=Nesterenkonia alba TaxID=515814 RepID=UPI0003B79E74|nr:cupin domain-containing protein [Nesterenkonia alba]
MNQSAGTPQPPPNSLPRFPGGTSVSHLCVYDWETPDGLHGGSPHLHTLSTEAYVVTAGQGAVQTISSEGPAEDTLQPGSLLWFTPGTIHRLINEANLELVVVMQNAGLPEAGDAVLTFPEEILADPQKYQQAVALPTEGPEEKRAEAARRRRDLAIEGQQQILEAFNAGNGPEHMRRLWRQATALVTPKIPHWRQIWSANVEAQAELTRRQLTALENGNGEHLGQSQVIRGAPRPGPRLFGMCGRLQTWKAEDFTA